jgi:cyanophycinase
MKRRPVSLQAGFIARSMKYSTLCLFAIWIITSPVLAKDPPPAGKLFIIGGGSRPDAMVDRIIDEAGLRTGGYAVILPMSSEEPDSAIYYAQRQFVAKGLKNIIGLNFKKGEVLRKDKLDSVRQARLIYISGGDQNRFMDVVRGTEIEAAIREAYQKGSVVSGSSAGAAVMSRVMITGNELKHPDYASTFKNIEADNIETKPGLGLLQQAIVDQHFVRRSRHNRLISAIIEFPELKGIGIDESTAILVKGNEVEVIGESQVLIYENPKRLKVVKNGKLGGKLTLTILLPGDRFNLK